MRVCWPDDVGAHTCVVVFQTQQQQCRRVLG
jgi:hypothetical protein